MEHIAVLDDMLINQIAAGEVVERPASVVKELVENSLDAAATRIDVAIAEGGLRWICVMDNGTGMAPRDAELAFRRHATSKIRSLEDLTNVCTLGFRGEALPSIASVARVRVRTRLADDSVGTELSFDAERSAPSVSAVACNPGTRIEVADLFARIPARRKFLKTPATESGHITRLIERIALARPDLRLSLERDGRSVLRFLPTTDLRERLIAVLAADVGERLIPFEAHTALGRVHGFAAPTDLTRGHTNDVHLFVNGRAVRDRLLLFAVRHAYRDALPPGRHPIAVVQLSLDPGKVDVNVHPTKAEVRFRDSEAVRQLVSHAIASAIGRDGARERSVWHAASQVRDLGRPLDLALAPYTRAPDREAAERESGLGRPSALLPGGTPSPREHEPTQVARSHVGPTAGALPFAQHRVLGQLLATYIVLESPEGLVLIDQHAAHERVLFERLRESVRHDKLERQVLLLPVWLELPQSAAEALAEHRQTLERVGYELEWGGRALRGGVKLGIKTVPALLQGRAAGWRPARSQPDWRALLEETASSLREDAPDEARGGVEAALHHAMATAACHAARRKGEHLAPEEIRALLESLDETVWFPNCPHGRPILQVFSESELERRFLRG